MTRVAVMLIVGGIALSPALAGAQDAAQVQRGQELFAAQKCALCHSVAGKGNPKGSLDGVGTKLSAADMHQWLSNAKEMAAKANATRKPPMKDFSTLPKADADAIVAYLQTLKK